MRSDERNGYHVSAPPVRANRIGGAAFRYLADRPRCGRVASRFSGGVNLLFEDGEAFVPLQTTAVPLHPWAIEILGEPLRLPEGTSVSAGGGELSLGDTRIPLFDAQIEELSLPRLSEEEAAIARRNLPILARFVEEARKTRTPDPFQPQIDAIVDRWHETGDPGALLGLIGFGAGSTPTGDDVLVGILAGISLFEGLGDRVEEALAQLRTGIQGTARVRTPLPSAQMLLAACGRSFPEPLLGLLGALASSSSEDDLLERAERVARLGHHSGIAILSGPIAAYS